MTTFITNSASVLVGLLAFVRDIARRPLSEGYPSSSRASSPFGPITARRASHSDFGRQPVDKILSEPHAIDIHKNVFVAKFQSQPIVKAPCVSGGVIATITKKYLSVVPLPAWALTPENCAIKIALSNGSFRSMARSKVTCFAVYFKRKWAAPQSGISPKGSSPSSKLRLVTSRSNAARCGGAHTSPRAISPSSEGTAARPPWQMRPDGASWNLPARFALLTPLLGLVNRGTTGDGA